MTDRRRLAVALPLSVALLLGAASAQAQQREEPLNALAVSGGIVGGFSGASPGGLRLSGEYNRRLRPRIILDAHLALIMGADTQDCYFDRTIDLRCNHDGFEGSAVLLGGGAIFPFGTPGTKMRPFARAGIELGRISFDQDNVSGGAFNLRGGGGLSWPIGQRATLRAEVDLVFGSANLEGRRDADVENSGISWLELLVGVAFAL